MDALTAQKRKGALTGAGCSDKEICVARKA